ncbi:MAG: hypothetical protein JNK71_13675 [Methyloversatilis sp.]|nr:hypothetical protein [Methyloversatilis sp.]
MKIRKYDLNSRNNLIWKLCWLALSICLTSSLNGCKESPRLPNPVISKDGVAYIPIDDTAFLIPEKSWLTGFSRKATDGSVGSITLHATVPDVQPWSQARHEEMYWAAGPGKKLRITIEGNQLETSRERFHEVPASRMRSFPFIEEPSDQAPQGLRRFRTLMLPYSDDEAKKDLSKFGSEFLEARKKGANKPMNGTVYYEFIEDNQVKYFIYCSDDPGPIWQGCHLSFPWARTLMIDIYFIRDDIPHIVSMADLVSEKLREFEAAGLARRSQSEIPAIERKE